jgi:hypothetical protein
VHLCAQHSPLPHPAGLQKGCWCAPLVHQLIQRAVRRPAHQNAHQTARLLSNNLPCIASASIVQGCEAKRLTHQPPRSPPIKKPPSVLNTRGPPQPLAATTALGHVWLSTTFTAHQPMRPSAGPSTQQQCRWWVQRTGTQHQRPSPLRRPVSPSQHQQHQLRPRQRPPSLGC